MSVDEKDAKAFFKDVWDASMRLMSKNPDVKATEIIFLLDEWVLMLKKVSQTPSTLSDDKPIPPAS